MSAGIDYGLGQTNINHETGIRYGVISQHAVTQAWCDSAEPDYSDATCPKCGNAATHHSECQEDMDDYEDGHGCADYVCIPCRYIFDSSEAFPDEPRGWSYDGDGYVLTDCLDSDIMVISSEFYTMGKYCSPCVPGAVSLERPDDDGAKAYCLSHDWFPDGEAPYPVFRVSDGTEVHPEKAK